MDPNYLTVKSSSASSALTVAHLIRNIEQLKNKDKLISQLEKDLGRHTRASAPSHPIAVLGRRRSEGSPLPSLNPKAFRTLPEGSDDPQSFLWSPTSIQTPGDVEDVRTIPMEGTPFGKTFDLPYELKESIDQNQSLVGTCRSFLQQNKHLSAQNRAFKECTERVSQESKNAQELLEQSKLQLMQMSRQMNELMEEREQWEIQMSAMEGLRQELTEDKKMINALRRACTEKDRRIELMQHRRKRRRVIESVEKVKLQRAGLKETPFGFEDDDRQTLDGNQSMCSVTSTTSDDSMWDDILSKEETERNYQRLMFEQLELQKAHALLQKQTEHLQDPQRENMSKTELQNDLFIAQCRIEQLEQAIKEGIPGRSEEAWDEREAMQARIKKLQSKVKSLEKERKRLEGELSTAFERNEDLEFRLIEMEQCAADAKDSSCQLLSSQHEVPASSLSSEGLIASLPVQLTPPTAAEEKCESNKPQALLQELNRTRPIMEQLAKDLNSLLQGKGRDAESALKKLDGLIDREKALETMAHELQMKVIGLQQEKNSLQDRLLLVEESYSGGKGKNNSISLTQAKERQENLALKASCESANLLGTDHCKHQDNNEELKSLNPSIHSNPSCPSPQSHQEIMNKDFIESSCQLALHSQIPVLPSAGKDDEESTSNVSQLKRLSCGRKSKCRDNSDPTALKKRRNGFEKRTDDLNESTFEQAEKLMLSDLVHDSVMNKMKSEVTASLPDSNQDCNEKDNKSEFTKQLNNMKNYNEDLIIQLHESIAKKLELESSHQNLQERIIAMEQDLDLLHRENVALGEQLRQRVEEFQMTQDERNPRISELEEFCEDLQERLKEAENCERLLRDKLKLYEKSIEEVEVQEMAMRERCEQLLTGDLEAKKQIQHLHSTGLELRDIVIEKEIVEQALRDKVDFLQKAEAASVQRIEELEGMVDELRQQLEEKSNGKEFDQKAAHKLTEMKHKLTFLETDNKALSSRVAELEENEETLRENWRRVAEEDFNRTQSLEEKVKMLENLNRELKVKLKEAQEYLVVDMSEANISLAAELAESDYKILDDSSDDNDVGDVEGLSGDGSPSKRSINSEKKSLRETVKTLERQLSEVKEQKNCKIESQQEQLAHLKETEIKLSETISEMEMTEREIRAKLALYESSEVTVEKMLKYQSKIEELRTSQESLLDQLELKENQEMTLQEQLQEMERTLRGKIVTLEVEMKGYKQRELKTAGYVRELEKDQSDLTTKVAQHEEKENSLYVKISSLMDQLKTSNTQLDSVKKQMEEKEDNIRQAKLLEVKILELEMECAKKVSTLDAKLRYRDEEFRQKESAFEEQITTLQDVKKENSQKQLEVGEKDEQISNLSSKISELQKNYNNTVTRLNVAETELENEAEKLREKESLIKDLEEEIEQKNESLDLITAEKEGKQEKEVKKYQIELQTREKKLGELQLELQAAHKHIDELNDEKMTIHTEACTMICKLQSANENIISEMEKKLSIKFSFLENKYECVKSLADDLKRYIDKKSSKISQLQSENAEQKKKYEECIVNFEKEKDSLKSDFESKLHFEMSKLSSEQLALLKESQEKEASLSFDVSNLQHQVDQQKQELITNNTKLEAESKANQELFIELNNLRHEHKELHKVLEKNKQSYSDLKCSMKSIIDEKDEIIEQIKNDKDAKMKINGEESKKIFQEKVLLESNLAEKCADFDRVYKLHLDSQTKLQQIMNEKEQNETKLKETEFHAHNVSVDKDNLSQELQSVKFDLDAAKCEINAQQQKLETLHSELYNHQTNVSQFESIIKEKEEMLQEKDHMYEQTSTELKKLTEQLKDRDQKLEQADCTVADVELKLQKAENRVRELEARHVSLEMRLEERYAVSQNAEQLLESKEIQCAEMQTKLAVAEKNLVNLKDQINVGNNSYKELAEKLERKEADLELTKTEMIELQQFFEVEQAAKVSLETKFQQLEQHFKVNEEKLLEDKKVFEKVKEEKEDQLKLLEMNSSKDMESMNELKVELDNVMETLREKEKNCEDNETKASVLETYNSELKTNCQGLQCKLETSNKELEKIKSEIEEMHKNEAKTITEIETCKSQLNSNLQELSGLRHKLENSEKLLQEKSSDLEIATNENASLKLTVENLSSEKSNISLKEKHLQQEFQINEEKYKNIIQQLESDNSDLTSVNEILRKKSSSLQDSIDRVENKLETKQKECDDYMTKNKILLSDYETLKERMNSSQLEFSSITVERDRAMEEIKALKEHLNQLQADNLQLQKEIEDATNEFQSLNTSFEKSKSVIENKLKEISIAKQSVQEKYENLVKEYGSQGQVLISKEKEVKELIDKCAILSNKNEILSSDFERIQSELHETVQASKATEVQEQIVCETMTAVNAAPSLNTSPCSNETLANKEKDEIVVQKALEKAINEMKEKENDFQKRISELETVEKELREQIVDIEITVIVPLENENQDLKDEIGIVKQERDEAISKISKWDDDDENGSEDKVQESELLHQRLEDSLIFGEELEKKNDILSKSIHKLENENEKLLSKISDLETSESEKIDEIETLQQEIEALNVSQEDTSILEETETTLMDRVLELEERERNLVEDLENVKKSVQNYSEVEDATGKIHYLQQKNQILEDAEGRFMDKIMELEEDKHRLLSQLSSFNDNPNPHMSNCFPIHPLPVHNTSSISTQTSSLPLNSNIPGANDQSSNIDSVQSCDISTNPLQKLTNPEHSEKLNILESQVLESKSKLEQLDAQLREKETVVLFLQDKLQLLEESEGKLMDKLLEAEEKASKMVYSQYSSQISELNQKIEQLQEENEFLAENVEQYKASFKEEKEKSNSLQDKLMDDTASLGELTKAQEELERTQQMVEDIQSEYEEQLSERMAQENKLKEELSTLVCKVEDLERMLNEKSGVEKELRDQVQHLKTVEKELSKASSMKVEDEDSAWSDSGLSADDHRCRTEHQSDKDQVTVEPPIHRSIKTIQLSPRSSELPTNSNNNANPRLPSDSSDNGPEPLPLPRIKRKLRLASIENIPHEELVLVVEGLQQREEALKKRISDLQSINEPELSQKVEQLEYQKCQLEKRLSDVSDENRNVLGGQLVNEKIGITSQSLNYSSSLQSSVVSETQPGAMLEKPEDVLNQRIKELEGLDKHNKNMLSELERDREVLHEIARKDKATIHDLSVKIRELQLKERSLKEQVSSLEVSEHSLFTKCEELESIRGQLEDRVHELEIHERRLRELVRKLKLDEEHWLSHSGGMENAMAELSANEAQLKRIVKDMELEKGGMSERVQYLNARIQELESVEISLLERIKAYESNEVMLQNRLVQLENAEAAAHSKASELDLLNTSLAQQHKKMVDENSIMNQHLAQLHGQVQDLDRRLLSSRDSEIAYKQHVESLQKNESLLQKKVREFELREIDSQSAIRELEQTIEINKDKLTSLQRSESRLKYRVQELECLPGQIPGELSPNQVENLPQNIEDCQRRVVVLQNQVENLKAQLRQTLTTTQHQPASKSDEEEKEKKEDSVNIGKEEYSQLHVKASLLDEYAYQNGELEAHQEHLRDTILQLRQGKGACGHEVEIEVCKRRIDSLQALINKLKLSLSEGQTTSLLGAELESGPQGETLPARHLQVLESERVLQSVRGLPSNGKANTAMQSNEAGLNIVEEDMVQAKVVQNTSSMPKDLSENQKTELPKGIEESHWKAIEAKKAVVSSYSGLDSRGEVNGQASGREEIKAVSSLPSHNNRRKSSMEEMEEVTGFLNLYSESELSSHHKMTHNDSDSCSSPVPPPRKHRANRASRSNYSSDDNYNKSGSGSERKNGDLHHHPSNQSTAAANHKHFDGVNNLNELEKSLPLTATSIEQRFDSTRQCNTSTPAPLSYFAEDSFYLPSSTQEGVDSLDDECPPPLPSNAPPGQEWANLSGSSSQTSSIHINRGGRKESLDNSTSGLSIRDRIAMIEKHLQSDVHTGSHSNREDEDQLFYWKRKSTESLRQADVLDRNNKFLKEDINRLEKELEEKRRYINTLEKWLSTTEGLLKNKTKQTDREMVEQLQLDLTKLRRELGQSGYRSEDVLLDAAALKTEVDHKDREISAKRHEIETLAEELRRCHKECRNIEGMRRNALDSLRSLEKEVVLLQDAEEKVKKARAEINTLKIQYDELEQFKNQALSMVHPLQMKVDSLSKKCREKDELLCRLGADLKQGHHPTSSALDELTRLDLTMNGEDYYTDNSDSVSEDYSPRPNHSELRARSASMDELSIHHNTAPLNHSFSDLESLRRSDFTHSGTPSSPLKKQRPTPYVNSRPRSAEPSSFGFVRSPRRSMNNTHPSMVRLRPNTTGPLQYQSRGLNLSSEHFVAIADYDPGLFSQSGRPGLELSLREGDAVRVNGPMDRSGYCEAECNGRTGLVPANYLQPVYNSGLNSHSPFVNRENLSSSVFHLHQQVSVHPQEFQDKSIQPRHNGFSISAVPDPPSGVHVRGVENGCLVLAWKPPSMDAKGCNKGLLVKGFVVFVDHQMYQQLLNPHHCETLVQGFDPSTPHHLAVQTLCSRGRVSPRAELVFEGAVRLMTEQEPEDELNTDLSSVLNSIHYSKGTKKKVMALHEYNPTQHSPHDYPTYELAFHAGDVISVYGEPRADGFYHGEVDGKRGLVPACFVEDLPARRGQPESDTSGKDISKA